MMLEQVKQILETELLVGQESLNLEIEMAGRLRVRESSDRAKQ